MASSNVIHQAAAGKGPERELEIEIYERFRVTFKGSSAQLIAEGLVPKGFKWPTRTGASCFTKDGIFTEVCRCHPGGKSRGVTWVDGDFWKLTRKEVGVDANTHSAVLLYLRYSEELKRSLRSAAEVNALMKRLWAAREDSSFIAHMRNMTKDTKLKMGVWA